MNANIKAAIIDIEGALCPISFVKNILVPFIKAELPDYIWDHEQELSNLIDAVKSVENNLRLSTEEVVEVLLRYLEDGQCNTSLDRLQSLILQEGCQSGEVKASFYDDALLAMERLKGQGIYLYAYSSAQVQAEQILLCHEKPSELFSGFFDMEYGEDVNPDSYDKIAARIGVRPDDILFISNNVEAVSAAYDAGMNVVILDREQEVPSSNGHQLEHSFDAIAADLVHA